jgi:hypothetical protein
MQCEVCMVHRQDVACKECIPGELPAIDLLPALRRRALTAHCWFAALFNSVGTADHVSCSRVVDLMYPYYPWDSRTFMHLLRITTVSVASEHARSYLDRAA